MNICGVDEVGRGPLAGCVVAAAVILPDNFYLKKLKDSKKMTLKARLYCYDYIVDNAVDFAIASASVDEIDSLNILQASKLAMVRSVQGLSVYPDLVNVDGNQKIAVSCPCKAIVGGDNSHIEIMAAAVLAKVYRDNLMIDLDKKHPQYDFASNKGYGTSKHLDALIKFGPISEHRKSFAPVKKLLET